MRILRQSKNASPYFTCEIVYHLSNLLFDLFLKHKHNFPFSDYKISSTHQKSSLRFIMLEHITFKKMQSYNKKK